MRENETTGPVESGIVKTLNYFGIFHYPLLPAEIHRFLPFRCTLEELDASLGELEKKGTVARSSRGFYTLDPQEAWSSERLAGNKRAMELLSRSVRFTRIIRSFPFVDAIAISGSLSKYYAAQDADIDYFIITQKNRLWVTRSLLHLFKKLTFIPGYQHFFCMNYFVDTEARLMTDQNIYTAIELATLIPVYNPVQIGGMKLLNAWLREYLPNAPQDQDINYLVPPGNQLFKRGTEWLLNQLWPGRFNVFLMHLTDRTWRKKWLRKGFPMEDYDRAFHTSVHASKNHPADFQKRILLALEKNNGKLNSGL